MIPGGKSSRFSAKPPCGTFHVSRAWIIIFLELSNQHLRAGEFVTAHTTKPVVTGEPIFCGIAGAEQPGREIVAGRFRVGDAPLRWEVSGRCGFAKDFTYSSEG